MMQAENISYLVAFTAGLLSFLSPCLLPLIPSFIAYISGVSFNDLKSSDDKKAIKYKTVTHSLLFILGFSAVFILLGLTATAVGKALFSYQKYIRIGGGILIAFFGLYLTGLIKLDFLLKERKLNVSAKRATYFGSFLVGVTFAAAWSPCAGPILGSILVLAGTKGDMAEGAKLLVAYSCGIGVPFLITGLAINSFIAFFEKFKNMLRYINIVTGVFLIIIGILVATNYLSVLSNMFMALFAR